MDRELGPQMDGVRKSEPWDRLVADAAACDHIVQLYQDQDFLNRAVCRFAGAALANGEGIILVPTLTHWNGIRPRLEAEGVDVEAARARGQLTVIDADTFLPRFMREAMPDSPVFLGLAADVIGEARAGCYQRVRWWGEMVNVLWERGDAAASMNLEDLFDQLATKHDLAIFCSFPRNCSWAILGTPELLEGARSNWRCWT
jgi:DcmR-like sensory protein